MVREISKGYYITRFLLERSAVRTQIGGASANDAPKTQGGVILQRWGQNAKVGSNRKGGVKTQRTSDFGTCGQNAKKGFL